MKFATAQFGQDNDSDSLYNFAFIRDDYILSANGTEVFAPAGVCLCEDGFFTGDNSLAHYGVALVRPVSSLPEPSTTALFTLSLLGLGFSRRKRL